MYFFIVEVLVGSFFYCYLRLYLYFVVNNVFIKWVLFVLVIGIGGKGGVSIFIEVCMIFFSFFSWKDEKKFVS